MAETILITGGAGFLGRRLARDLLARGAKVRALDCLLPQVHGDVDRPQELDDDVELVVGDVRDPEAVARALQGVDAVAHLAAEVGVGQSMYAVERYVGVNDVGTAVLFEALMRRPVRRVVVASSMSIYGEGAYSDADGRLMDDIERPARASDGRFDPTDAQGRPLSPAPTPESKRPALASVYAITKYVQERLTLTLAPRYGMEGVALRLWNAFGPGQALSNPYTGVLAIFASRIAKGRSPLVFEDGAQLRDFVHVDDVARAFALALDHPKAAGETFNIGSGVARSVAEVARDLAAAMGRPEIEPEITGEVRAGDVRHNIPDLTKARTLLGYEAQTPYAPALSELADWVSRQKHEDRVADAKRELEARGLVA